MTSQSRDRIRKWVALLKLKTELAWIAHRMSDPDSITTNCQVATGCEWERSPEIAILNLRQVTEISNWRVEILAKCVENLELKRQLFKATYSFREAIAQQNVPADMALSDGNGELAIEICVGALTEAQLECLPLFKSLASDIAAELALLGSLELTTNESTEALGMTVPAFLELHPIELSEVINSWRQRKERTSNDEEINRLQLPKDRNQRELWLKLVDNKGKKRNATDIAREYSATEGIDLLNALKSARYRGDISDWTD